MLGIIIQYHEHLLSIKPKKVGIHTKTSTITTSLPVIQSKKNIIKTRNETNGESRVIHTSWLASDRASKAQRAYLEPLPSWPL